MDYIAIHANNDRQNRVIIEGRAMNWRDYCVLAKDIATHTHIFWRAPGRVTEAAGASWDEARVYPRHPAKTRQQPSYGRLEPIVHMGRY